MSTAMIRKIIVYAMAIISLLGMGFIRSYYLVNFGNSLFGLLSTMFAWLELICAVTALTLVSVFKKESTNKKICFAMAIAILSIVGLTFILDSVLLIILLEMSTFPYLFIAGIEAFLFAMFMRKGYVNAPNEETVAAKGSVDDLLKYKNLLDQGVITQSEYDQIKEDIFK